MLDFTRRIDRLSVLIACLLTMSAAFGATVNVASLPALEKAIAVAQAGDEIVLADGVYEATRPIHVDCAGKEDRPITIAAQSVGGAEIKGAGGFAIGKSAAYVLIRGFKLTHAGGAIALPVGSHHCRITRNVIELANTGKAPYIAVGGNDHEIDHNTFQNKRVEGPMITVQGPLSKEVAQRTWIHHNYFYNFKPTANNCSAIQIGLSSRSMHSACSVVEYNLFVQTAGENEGGVCNKSCDNVYRFNTFGEGCTELSLRHGNRCQVYGNFFMGSEGVRFYGHDHRIYSNYFERCSPAINIGNGDAVIPPGALTAHDRPVGVHIVFNTLVNNPSNLIMAGRKNGLGAADIAVANNIILGGGKAAAISGTIENGRWEGNILWSNQAGSIPAGGFVSVDPQLKRENGGSWRLEKGSPAVGAAAGTYPFVTVDVEGQARGEKPDAGAGQFSAPAGAGHPLTVADVGPAAVEGPRVRPQFPPHHAPDAEPAAKGK